MIRWVIVICLFFRLFCFDVEKIVFFCYNNFLDNVGEKFFVCMFWNKEVENYCSESYVIKRKVVII